MSRAEYFWTSGMGVGIQVVGGLLILAFIVWLIAGWLHFPMMVRTELRKMNRTLEEIRDSRKMDTVINLLTETRDDTRRKETRRLLDQYDADEDKAPRSKVHALAPISPGEKKKLYDQK